MYLFDELSEDVQNQIIERECWNVMEQCMNGYNSEYRASLKAFEELTKTKANNWQVDYCGYYVNSRCSNEPIYEHPLNYDKDIYAENLCGKLLFRYLNNNIMPHITKGKDYSTPGKYINEKFSYKCRQSKVILEYRDNCPLTGTCCDYYFLEPIVDYYKSWCNYPADYSLQDLIQKCYDNFFKCWHEEYEYWADDKDAIREELHSNQYEKRLYHKDGEVYCSPLKNVV